MERMKRNFWVKVNFFAAASLKRAFLFWKHQFASVFLWNKQSNCSFYWWCTFHHFFQLLSQQKTIKHLLSLPYSFLGRFSAKNSSLLIQLANDVIITAFNWCRCGEEGTWESLSKLLLTKSHVRSSRFLLIESPVIRSHDLKAFNLFENLKLDFTTSNTSILESFHCHLLSLLNFQ